MPPARPQLPNMRQWGLLPFLLPLVFLWSVQEPELAEGFFFRICPKQNVPCEIQERDHCTRHRQCPARHKCCMFACGKKCIDLKADICSMPEDPGPCLAYIPRWWYNKGKGRCSEFIYGGCKGNANNFQSKAVCLTICKNK